MGSNCLAGRRARGDIKWEGLGWGDRATPIELKRRGEVNLLFHRGNVKGKGVKVGAKETGLSGQLLIRHKIRIESNLICYLLVEASIPCRHISTVAYYLSRT